MDNDGVILETVTTVPPGATAARLQLRVVDNAIVPSIVFDVDEAYAFAVVIKHDDPQAREQLRALVAAGGLAVTVA